MNRTAALDFNPLSRPAPITMASNAQRQVYPSVSREDINRQRERETRAKAAPAAVIGKSTPTHLVLDPERSRASHHRETYERADPDGYRKRCTLSVAWAKALREIMAKTGAGQYSIAMRLGVARSTVRYWLSGQGGPSPVAGRRFVQVYREVMGQEPPTA